MVGKGGGAEGRGRGPWKVALMGLRDEQHGWWKASVFQAPGGRLPRRSGEGWEPDEFDYVKRVSFPSGQWYQELGGLE